MLRKISRPLANFLYLHNSGKTIEFLIIRITSGFHFPHHHQNSMYNTFFPSKPNLNCMLYNSDIVNSWTLQYLNSQSGHRRSFWDKWQFSRFSRFWKDVLIIMRIMLVFISWFRVQLRKSPTICFFCWPLSRSVSHKITNLVNSTKRL